jgi:Amt family ammonium transporter
VFGPSKLGGFIGDPTTFALFRQVPMNNVNCLAIAPNLPGSLYATFQMMFALMVPVIVTGAWAEKLTMKGFFVFIVLWPLMVYYPIAHWVWGGGWMSGFGVTDFAGGITIHTNAGVAGLVVSLVLQKRRNLEKLQMTHHNIPLLVIGGTLVWAGWYSFNGCSALAANVTAGLTLLNTHLSGSTAALCWVALTYRHDKCFHVTDIMNGAFAGLAGVTPCSGYAEPQGAFVIGLLTGVTSWHTCKWLKSDKLYIDDVLDCFSLQAVPGMMGSILVGFFKGNTPEMGYNPKTDPDGSTLGLFYGGNGLLLGAQVIGTFVTALMSACMTYIIMMIIKRTVGIDITWEEEDAGLDKSQIGEIGYDYISIADDPMLDAEDLTQELVEAAALGNLGKCRTLLKAGANVTKGDYDKRTALHLAAAEGRLEICKWCISKGANVHALDNFDQTPFEDAVLHHHQDICQYLESVGGTMDESRIVGMLCEAAFDGDVAQCAQLTDRVRTSVTAADYDGRTALHVAVCENNLAVVRLLTNRGADPVGALDRWGQSPLDNAKELSLGSMVRWLQGNIELQQVRATQGASPTSPADGADAAASTPSTLRRKLTSRRSALINSLETALLSPLSSGNLHSPSALAPTATPFDLASTPLTAAEPRQGTRQRRLSSLRRDDDDDDEPQSPVTVVNTPGQESINKEFMKLAASGNLQGIKNLTEKGANPAEGDYDKRTPLHIAAANGHSHVLNFLVTLPRVNVNAVDRFRVTPLADALKNKSKDSAEILKRHGGTVMNSNYGSTLCAAAFRGDIEKLQSLLDCGVDLSTGDYDGRTALHLAVCEGHVKVVAFLISHDAGLNVVDRMHNTPTDDAVTNNQLDILAALQEAGALVSDSVVAQERSTPILPTPISLRRALGKRLSVTPGPVNPGAAHVDSYPFGKIEMTSVLDGLASTDPPSRTMVSWPMTAKDLCSDSTDPPALSAVPMRVKQQSRNAAAAVSRLTLVAASPSEKNPPVPSPPTSVPGRKTREGAPRLGRRASIQRMVVPGSDPESQLRIDTRRATAPAFLGTGLGKQGSAQPPPKKPWDV